MAAICPKRHEPLGLSEPEMSDVVTQRRDAGDVTPGRCRFGYGIQIGARVGVLDKDRVPCPTRCRHHGDTRGCGLQRDVCCFCNLSSVHILGWIWKLTESRSEYSALLLFFIIWICVTSDRRDASLAAAMQHVRAGSPVCPEYSVQQDFIPKTQEESNSVPSENERHAW